MNLYIVEKVSADNKVKTKDFRRLLDAKIYFNECRQDMLSYKVMNLKYEDSVMYYSTSKYYK